MFLKSGTLYVLIFKEDWFFPGDLSKWYWFHSALPCRRGCVSRVTVENHCPCLPVSYCWRRSERGTTPFTWVRNRDNTRRTVNKGRHFPFEWETLTQVYIYWFSGQFPGDIDCGERRWGVGEFPWSKSEIMKKGRFPSNSKSFFTVIFTSKN